MKPRQLLILGALLVSASAAAKKDKADDEAWDISEPFGPTETWTAELSEGTWMALDVHPEGDRLVFDLLGDLYTLPIGGGAATPLMTGPAWEHDARWSPDGGSLLFVSDRGGNQELWIRDLATGEDKALTTGDPERFVEGTWSPDGRYVVARKRITDTRSIGMCELWLFDVRGGDGVKLTETSASPFPNEAVFSADGAAIYYSATPWRFQYGRDPAGGIFNLHRMELETGEVTRLTGETGGAFRPTLNPKTGQLAVMRRVGADTTVELFDPETGARTPLAAGFEHDNQEGFAINGLYPHADWTPDGEALLLWDDGGIVRIDGETGERSTVPFTAEVRHVLHEPVRNTRAVADSDDVEAKLIRWPRVSPSGERVVFEAFGRLWLQGVDEASARPITAEGARAFAPIWSPDGERIAYATWDDEDQGAIRIWTGEGKLAPVVTTLPAQYLAPSWSPDGSSLAWLRGSGATLRGGDTGGELWFRLEVLDMDSGTVRDVSRLDWAGSRAPAVGWSPDGQRLLVPASESRGEPNSADRFVLKSMNLEGKDHETVARWDKATQVAVSPDGRRLAWQEGWKVHVTELPPVGGLTLSLTSDGGPFPVETLSEGAGDWLGWYGEPGELAVSHSSGATLTLGGDGLTELTELKMRAVLPRSRGSERFAYAGVRVITMGPEGVIEDGYVVVDGERIEAVGAGAPPAGVSVIEAAGKTVIPGLIDVHAHLHYGFSDAHPERSWRHAINLAYGVTTVHDPSANSDIVFGISERIAAGLEPGPRVYSTGAILYGAKGRSSTPVASLDDARMNMARMKALGAISVKSYQQPGRDQRQWVLQAAREAGLNVYPEGGGELMQNLTMLVDGHTGIEHSMPVAPLYADVRGLYAASGAGYTPTLLVAYGGLGAEHYYFQTEDLLGDEKWRHFTPPGVVDRVARRRGLLVHDGDWFHRVVAESAAQLQREGVPVLLGAHGQLQGLGAHWELWALGEAMGPLGALRAGTIDAAWYLGLEGDLGSVEVGKLADLVLIDGDPLADLRRSRDIVEVVQGGIRRDGETLEIIE